MLSFFNDVEGKEREAWYPSVQYFGTQGFFGTYNARVGEPLSPPLADLWSSAAAEIAQGREFDRTERARQVLALEDKAGASVTAESFLRGLTQRAGSAATPRFASSLLSELQIAPSQSLTR